MSRSGYSEDDDNLAAGRWRGMVASSIRGKRGQAFLRALLKALDDMPEKRLITNDLEAGGEVCAIGALGRARGIDMSGIDPEDPDAVAATFDIAEPLAREIVYYNDTHYTLETPEHRWTRMRGVVAAMVKDEAK